MSDTLNLAALAEPFPAAEIEWRVGSTNKEKTKGLALAYLTARHVMDRLDTIVGPTNWQDRYEFHGARTVCYLSLRVGDEWITKADGAGDSDVEAEKGAISDALKRAAVKWGIGRYLYETGTNWVAIEEYGRSYRIVASEMTKLQNSLERQFGKAANGNGELKAALVASTREPPPAGSLDANGKPYKHGMRIEPEMRNLWTELKNELDACLTLAQLAMLWASKPFQEEFRKIKPDWQAQLVEHKELLKTKLSELAGYSTLGEHLDRMEAQEP